MSTQSSEQFSYLSLYSGFSLFEVLIAWVITSTIMLGVLMLATESLREVHHRYLQTIALTSLQEMLDRLRANKNEVIREHELELWNQQNQDLLPRGIGQFNCDVAAQACQITINWQEQQLQTLQIQALI